MTPTDFMTEGANITAVSRASLRSGSAADRTGRNTETARALVDPDYADSVPRKAGVDWSLLLKDKEAAALLGISRATFWKRVGDGTLPGAIRIGAATRWRRDEIEGFIEQATAARDAGEAA